MRGRSGDVAGPNTGEGDERRKETNTADALRQTYHDQEQRDGIGDSHSNIYHHY